MVFKKWITNRSVCTAVNFWFSFQLDRFSILCVHKWASNETARDRTVLQPNNVDKMSGMNLPIIQSHNNDDENKTANRQIQMCINKYH